MDFEMSFTKQFQNLIKFNSLIFQNRSLKYAALCRGSHQPSGNDMVSIFRLHIRHTQGKNLVVIIDTSVRMTFCFILVFTDQNLFLSCGLSRIRLFGDRVKFLGNAVRD